MRKFLFLFAIGAALTLPAALQFEAPQAFPEVGLNLPVPARSIAVPQLLPPKLMPAPGEDPYLLRADTYLTRDLWLEPQQLASWHTQEGVRVTIHHLLYRAPSELARAYRKAYAGLKPDLDPDSPDDLLDWASALLWQEVNDSTRIIQNAFSLAVVDTVAGEDGRTFLFLCRAYTNNFVKAPWFAVQVVYRAPVAEVEVRELMLKTFFSRVSRLSERDCAALPEPLSSAGKPLPAAVPGVDSFLLEAARRQLRHAEGWWLDVIGSYIVQSDTSSEVGLALAETFKTRQIPLHNAFTTLVPPFEKQLPTAFVRIVGSDPLYRYYAGEGNENSGGIYTPLRKELVLRMAAGMETLEGVLRHESFHQYLDAAWGGLATSAWFNEGHAVFFQQSEYDPLTKRLTFPEHPLYATLVTENFEAILQRLPDFLRYSYADFYARSASPGEASINYATAWAFIYFLHKEVPGDIRSPFPHVLSRYADAIRLGHSPAEATDHAFKDITDKALRDRFRSFWMSSRSDARNYDPLKQK